MATANLLFFLSDNHARSAVGCYGNPQVQTPVLDGLAARGTRFSAAYTASPICCPARAAIATGRYPHQTGYWDNAIVYDGRVRSWMHELRDAGYDVVSIGKLHFRSSADDNGFTREIAPMHILNAKGGVSMLLRWSGREPVNRGQWELYVEESGLGETAYQAYDRDISARAIAWLERRAARTGRPFALFVSYVSAHPPFAVPERLYELYRDLPVTLPPAFAPHERPEHPSLAHLRRTMGFGEITDPDVLRRIIRCYWALSTHLDEQIGSVLAAAEAAGLLDATRVIYTSDHGEALGAHGLFGKYNLLEPSAGVPLIMAGPDIPENTVIGEPVSHVDLYATIVEGAGLAPRPGDPPLGGESLWPILAGAPRSRAVFGEYHAAGSASGHFMLRRGSDKLIHVVGTPPQLFDLAKDPDELHDLSATAAGRSRIAALEAELRSICDPELVDRRAKHDQRLKSEFWGGDEAILAEGLLVYTPPPGVAAETVPGSH